MKIEYRPIGIVHTPFTSTEGMPIQPSRAKGAEGTVEVEKEYAEGLSDLDAFSHIILLCHFHRARPARMKVVPFLDDVERGLFATRAPSRPNPIGLSVVRLTKIVGRTLHVADVDLLDGTPVLDIKPYVGEFDRREEARFGWLEDARARERDSDGRFE
jgi:tRNA-Thr(GGU) m(6)t(6)A37 methyltransferase TsaA